MTKKWNFDPEDPVCILRLISELEGCCGFVDCLDDAEEEFKFLDSMRKKYYKMYFKMIKEQKKNETESSC